MTLSLDTAYRSFGGEVEASSTPTICRLPDSRCHQLSAIALRVDEQEPRPLRPQQVAISERFDRRRMETGRTADPAGQDWRWQAHGDHAGGGERPDVHSVDRLSVARDPERPAAEKLGLRLLRSVDL